jgi:hypothetical protein
MVMSLRSIARGWRALACAAVTGALTATLLSGCGGGGGGSSSSSSSGSTTTGSLTVRLIGGGSADYAHAYVTLTAIAFNTDADKPWSASDSSWQVVTFGSPLQVDLANLANGSYAGLLSQASLPTGTYRQLRLFVASSGGQATDASGATTPIEWPDVLLGQRVPISFSVTKNTLTQIYLQWDLGHSLAPVLLSSGSPAALSLRPNLASIDIASSSGAIVGTLDTTDFCTGTTRSGCVSNVVASAQVTSTDGSRHVTVLSTMINPSTGAFRLFPLPSGGTFDVVFTGRNMRPLVVTSVTAAAIDLFTNGTHVNPTGSGSTTDAAIPVTLVTPDTSSAALALTAPQLADASVWVGQSLSGGTVPYEWAAASVDPFTGQFAASTYLPSGSAIDSTSYTGSTLVWTTGAAADGASTYRIKAYGTSYDLASSLQTVTPPAAATRGAPDTGLGTGTISVTVGATTPANYDHAQVVVSDVNGVVLTQDVSSGIASPTTVPLTVPVGATAASLGGTAVYSVSVRGWKTATPQSGTWARSTAALDLRSATSASVSLTLP